MLQSICEYINIVLYAVGGNERFSIKAFQGGVFKGVIASASDFHSGQPSPGRANGSRDQPEIRRRAVQHITATCSASEQEHHHRAESWIECVLFGKRPRHFQAARR